MPPKVEVGVRPEDVAVFEHPGPGLTEGRMLLAEPLGNETIVTLLSEGHRVVARAPADFGARPESPVFFSVSAERVLFFDVETGRRFD